VKLYQNATNVVCLVIHIQTATIKVAIYFLFNVTLVPKSMAVAVHPNVLLKKQAAWHVQIKIGLALEIAESIGKVFR
jgi:hypothetical protein